MMTWVTRLAGASAALFVTGPLLSSLGVVPPLVGFGCFGIGGFLGFVALVLGVVSLARGRGAGAGLVVAAGVTVVFLFAALPGRSVPRINDITTDTVNPPEFVHAPKLSGNQGRDMKYPGASFAEQQKAGYADLDPLRMNSPVDDVFKKVESAARDLPNTEVTYSDPAGHRLEGVTTSRLFRFQDDFVVEVRPADGGSLVQMRSKSRVGKGDVGANAARIHALFARLQ